MTTVAPSKDEQLAARAQKAKRVIAAAQRKSVALAGDQAQNRTTRNRNAMKHKADALDRVAEILAGKDT